MPSSRVYWDAVCFLSYLNGDEGRIEVLDALLEEAANGERTIVTSMISLTEVAYTASERKGDALSDADEQAIDALLASRQGTVLIEFNERIARDARGLMRSARARGWSLRPMDAIHVASAQFAGVSALHTYDERLFRLGDLVEFTIGPPSGANLRLDLEDSDA